MSETSEMPCMSFLLPPAPRVRCAKPATHAVKDYFARGSDRRYYLCAECAASWNKRPMQAQKAEALKS